MLKWLILLFAFGAPVQASEIHPPDEVTRNIPGAQALASSRFSYMFWELYDATLYASLDATNELKPPFALRLAYLIDLDGRAIADRSIEEIRLQRHVDEIRLAQWHSQIREIFPNVRAGEALTGIVTSDMITRFYRNGQFIGQVTDPEFTLRFFNIWLGKKSSDRSLRARLAKRSSLGEPQCALNFCK